MTTRSRFWSAARNATLKVVAFWVLLFAAYLAIGRQFFPYIDRLQPELEVWLTEQLGTEVQIGELRGEWVRFNPVVHMENVSMGDQLTLSKVTLAPGIYESLSRGGLSFIRFEVVDFKAELIETVSGWQMTGLSSNESNAPIALDDVLTLVRRQEEVRFENTELSIRPANLPAFKLTMNEGRLTGYGTENGLIANATLTARNLDVPIELQLETTEQAEGANRLYFKHGNIDITPWLERISPDISSAILAGEYWVNLVGDEWQTATVRLDAEEIIYQGPSDSIRIRETELETYIEERANGFEAWINLLGYEVNETRFDSTQAKLSYRADRVKAQWDSLPANLVSYWFALNDPNGFWNGISPSGFLEQGTLLFTEGVPGSMKIAAQVSDFAMQAHNAVPAIENLSGKINLEGRSGELLLAGDNATIGLPNLYETPYQANVDRAFLRWDGDPTFGLSASGDASLDFLPPDDLVEFESALPTELYWFSNTPNQTQKEIGRDSTFEYQMSIPQMSRNWALHLTDNFSVNPNTVALIDRRMETADFSDVHLDYMIRSDIERNRSSQFFVRSDFENAQIGFLDNWYSLESVDGQLFIDREGIQITAADARYPGFSLPEISMDLDYETARLDLNIALESSVEETMKFLQTGPLRTLYNDNLDSWAGTGEVAGRVRLEVPLRSPGDFEVDLESTIKETSFAMNNIGMAFEGVNGQLNFQRDRGIWTENLVLTHEGLRQDVTVTSDLTLDTPSFFVTARGRTPVDYWGRRFDDPFLMQQRVSIEHDTTVSIQTPNILIESVSNGEGIALDLPEPLNKETSAIMPLELTVKMDARNWTTVKAELDNRLISYFELDQEKQMQRGAVAFNSELDVREDDGIYFDITVDEANGNEWWTAIQELRALYTPSAPSDTAPGLETLIRSIAIQGNELTYLSQPWSAAEVTILRNDDAWLVDFGAEQGQGQILVPHDETPIFADIEWVSLTTGEEDIAYADQVDSLEDYHPQDVPPMQLQINNLIWNERDMGSWRTELIHESDALVATNIQGDMAGADLRGTLSWQKQEGKHATQFIGSVEVANVLDVLNTWQYAPVLTSSMGNVEIDSAWSGSPAFFDFKRLEGSIKLALNRGSILQVEEYEGVKLIGLLNFTRVIRRIALDFSDLLQEGIAYDVIEGELLFDRGFARVGEQLVIDGSATKFKFSGDADLLSDELDIDMVLTVPLSSTFPLVALLAGVSPQAAAAIYVTERVFNNELERLSSARMHITGSFEEPETRFYRAFDNNLGETGPTVSDRILDVVPEGVNAQ